MNLLALETTTEWCSVALWRAGEIDAQQVEAGQRHSSLLLGMVDALLARHALSARDLDGYAYGAGPGSFTGVRIGCGVAQGLAYAAGVPLVGICTLLALAEASGAPRVVACLDARMGELYHAAYVREGGRWSEVHAPQLCRPATAPELDGAGWTGCGSGYGAYPEALAQRYAQKLERVMPQLVPHAREVAALAAIEFAQGDVAGPEAAAPLYVRNKVALRVAER